MLKDLDNAYDILDRVLGRKGWLKLAPPPDTSTLRVD